MNITIQIDTTDSDANIAARLRRIANVFCDDVESFTIADKPEEPIAPFEKEVEYTAEPLVPTVSQGGVELDTNDLPWDARIHGVKKSKNKDGTWKYTKGVDKVVLVPQVEAELRATLAAVPPTPSDETVVYRAPAVSNEPPPPPAGLADGGTAPPIPSDETVVYKAPPTSTEMLLPPKDFMQLLMRVTAAKTAGIVTDEQMTAVAVANGLEDFGKFALRPDLVPAAAAALGV